MIGLDRKELLTNSHFRVLFIRGIKKSVSIFSNLLIAVPVQITREELGEAFGVYGVVQTFTLKTEIVGDQVLSRGIAIVQYETKEAAAEALKKLPFRTELGRMLDVDFYQSKESRMVQMESQQMPSMPLQ